MHHLENLLDVSHEHSTTLSYIAEDLENYADAFSHIGNEKVATDLARLARGIRESAQHMERAVSEELSGSFREAEQSAFNTIHAVLAVSTRL